jgi:hypothetical protein
MMPRGYHTLPNISFVLSQILIWINKCHQFWQKMLPSSARTGEHRYWRNWCNLF